MLMKMLILCLKKIVLIIHVHLVHHPVHHQVLDHHVSTVVGFNLRVCVNNIHLHYELIEN